MKWKVLALSFGTDHPDPPFHHRDQLLADRQPEPGSAEAPRDRSVRLREGLKDPGLFDAGMPMPVSRTETWRSTPASLCAASTTPTETPPCSVNLSALPTRLIRAGAGTGSPIRTGGTDGSTKWSRLSPSARRGTGAA